MKMRIFLFSVLILTLFSCAPKKIISTGHMNDAPAHRAEPPKETPAPKPYDPKRTTAWKNAVRGALRVGAVSLAEKNLQTWQFENANATASWDWNQAKAHFLLANNGELAYFSYLADLVGRTDLDWTTREAAGMEMVDFFWKIPEYGRSFSALGLIYKAAPDDAARSALELLTLEKAQALSLDDLHVALANNPGEDPASFPRSMLIWAQGVKSVRENTDYWPAIFPSLSSIVRDGGLASKEIFARNLATLKEHLGVVKHQLVLLLPLSGPYAQVGWRIAKGADCAWREGRSLSEAPEIKLINTESDTFLDDLRALNGTSIVGGPLRKDIWEKIRAAGLHRLAHFLTFLPSVSDEGVEAWRFFSSPEDQVRALLLASKQIGVTSYAVLHPQDHFGTAMAESFQNQATLQGVQVPTVRSYPVNPTPDWGKVVASVLGVTGKKNALNPDPPFGAVFIPDSLSQVQQMAPYFHYYEETRLLFLGPQLWTQSLADSQLELQYFELTLFPGAWNPATTCQSAERLRKSLAADGQDDADLWSALGYDFVRFTALIGTTDNSAEAFNQALTSAASRMDWCLAPMRWDNGRGAEDLFLFQPTAEGMKLANLTDLENTRRFREELREKRRLQLQEEAKQAAQGK